jgi:hypothetical protein
MIRLPVKVDWPELISNIRSQGRLYELSSVARAAKLERSIVTKLNNGHQDTATYETAAPLLNLFITVCPDKPIPERKA